MRSRRFFLAHSLAAVSAGWLCRELFAVSNAEMTLAKAGLVRQGSGLWLLPQERRLRSQLSDLSTLRDSITVLDRELAERVKQNRDVFESTRPTIESLKQSLSRLASNDPKRKSVERQLASEQAKSTPPEQLGGRGDIRALLVQLSQQRIALTLRLLFARRVIPELIADYSRLAEDGVVLSALTELGNGHRLGPIRPLDPELRRLGEFDSAVFTSHVPIWLQSGRIRLTAIVAEQQPLTLTWNEYPGQGLVLTSGAAQTLDIHAKPGAESRELEFAKGRKVRATRAMLSSLRLARSVVANVPVWILAPEGEDLGSQLDSTALDGYTARCEPAALRLTLQSRE